MRVAGQAAAYLGPAPARAGTPGAAQLLGELGGGFLALFSEFVGELRSAGLPVATTEVLDAAEALRQLPWEDRQALKWGLGAALVKQEGHWRAFEALFELYFPPRLTPASLGAPALAPLPAGQAVPPSASALADLADMAFQALLQGSAEALAEVARAAVGRYAGIEAGRSVSPGYYALRTLRQLGVDGLADRLMGSAQAAGGLEGALLAREYRRRLDSLRALVEAEARRELLEQHGPKALAHLAARPLPEDVDFMHLSRDELAALERAVAPLARKLAVHLARRRRKHLGRLDFRATARRSLATGGVPIEPRFKARQRSKPELWVLADVSGSVAAFARFTLQLVYALSSQFSRTRAWAFVDGIDEVTTLLHDAADVAEAVRKVNTVAQVVWEEGHSDYGHALSEFVARWGKDLSPRTTVLVLGDARNNYHATETWAIADIARRARHLWWLNPEPRAYWDTGDSVLAHYGAYCTGVQECRNLRQLRRFVEQLP